MPISYEQGDIFQVGVKERCDFLLVFGHIGFNEMAQTWREFRVLYPNLRNIADPFNGRSGPISFSPGKWVQFVPEEENRGMRAERLAETIDAAFKWAAARGLRSVITNGIMDIDHDRSTQDNRASDDRRVRYINEIVSAHLPNFDSIKLISLNDAFVRNFHNG